MPQLKEIFEKESQRGSLEQCLVVHLFKEGTFYRAYEWSAWLGLELHEGKLLVASAWHGVEFLGAWVKPHRIYMSRNSVGRIRRKLRLLAAVPPDRWAAPLNSYCGLLGHWQNYRLRSRLLMHGADFGRHGVFDMAVRHYAQLP